MRFGVVVVAAGKGERLKQSQRKALVPVGGKSLIFHCLEIFSAQPDISEIVLVLHPGDMDHFREPTIAAQLSKLGIHLLVAGGARRQDSVLAGLRAFSPEIEAVLVHDAARPFVGNKTLKALMLALEDSVAAVPVLAASSTVKKLHSNGVVERTLDRSKIALAQTPQGARLPELIEALENSLAKGTEVTDDVQAMELMGHSITTIPDSKWNFKVTTPEDLLLAEFVFAQKLHEKEES